MPTTRSAPRSGYDFGNKRQYRRTIWNTFATFCGTGRANSHALLMPSLEGDEIETAIQNGFREEHLHVVDKSAAIVATLKRRWPKLNTYGVELGRAGYRVAESGRVLSVANLDLCGPVGAATFRELASFMAARPVRRALLAVTVLRGRERPNAFGVVRCAAEGRTVMCTYPGQERSPWRLAYEALDHKLDHGRITMIATALSGNVSGDGELLKATSDGLDLPYTAYVSRAGTYRSSAGSQTMLWGVFKVHRVPCPCNLCIARFAAMRGASLNRSVVDAYDSRLRDLYGISLRECVSEAASADQ